jgi:hypothetical protein
MALHESATHQQVGQRTRFGPVVDPSMRGRQEREQLPGVPAGMSHHSLAIASESLCWHGCGGAAAITESTVPLLLVVRDPFVSRLPTHPMAGTEFRHRKAVTQGILHELKSLVHLVSLQPGHRALTD